MKKIFLTLMIISILIIIKPGNANAQTCPTVPTNTGRVTLPAEGYTEGTYKVWSRMKAADATNNSFYLQIDSTCPVLVQTPSTSFVWVSNANNINLSAGNHVITIIGNHPGVGVDKILLTKNLSCIPDNTIPPVPNNFAGTNCPVDIIATPTVGAADITPPVISNPRVEEVTGTTAKIRWELSENASGQVEYRSVGSSTWQQTGLQPCTPTDCAYNYHIQSITGLSNGTTYEYRIKSADAAGNSAPLNTCIFTAGGAPIQACGAAVPTSTPTPSPLPTNTPSPTLNPAATVLRFTSVKLHGIGSGGDNTNPNIGGNQNPIITSRTLSVVLENSSGSIPATEGTITYKPATGDFSGDITLGSNVTPGQYLIKVKSPQYLQQQLIRLMDINTSAVNLMPTVSLSTGDINNDNQITVQGDYNILIGCYSDLLPAKNCDEAKKAAADISSDGYVNADDYNLFLRELSVVKGD